MKVSYPNSVRAIMLALFLQIGSGSLLGMEFTDIPGASEVSDHHSIQMTEQELLPSLPVGALVKFPMAVDTKYIEKLPSIFVKAQDSEKVWLAEPRPILNAQLSNMLLEQEQPVPAIGNKSYLGFIVPQLAKGRYKAWFDDDQKAMVTSMEFYIDPALQAERPLIVDNMKETVQIAVNIQSTLVQEKEKAEPTLVTVPVTISSLNPEVADVVPSESGVKITDANGVVSWRVSIKSQGTAEFVARAVGFEPAQITVVSVERSAPAVEQVEERLESAQLRTSATERKANKTIDLIAIQRITVAENPQDRRANAKLSSLSQSLNVSEQKLAESREVENNITSALSRLKGASAGTVTEEQLQPGDVLEVSGQTFFVSNAIRLVEQVQFHTSVNYSHSALYLGTINGKKMVAEMCFGGYKLHTLREATDGIRFADVFRWNNITPEKQNQIAERGASVCGDPAIFLSRKETCVPYAMKQIGFLGAIAVGAPPRAAHWFARSEDGPNSMICSELVARVYSSLGLKPNASHWWDALENSGIFNDPDRRLDYTTPNTIGNSTMFTNLGRLVF